MASFTMEDYQKAYKLGKKDYQARMMRGELPTLQVLDDILPPKGSYSEVPLGLVQIPIDQIVGTKSDGRSNAFAGNFMPILRENTEFAYKWATLSQSHIDKGIREPIKAYEYMNKFYVQEGNKRVSVLKYFDAVSVPGYVTRILPDHGDKLSLLHRKGYAVQRPHLVLTFSVYLCKVFNPQYFHSETLLSLFTSSFYFIRMTRR